MVYVVTDIVPAIALGCWVVETLVGRIGALAGMVDGGSLGASLVVVVIVEAEVTVTPTVVVPGGRIVTIKVDNRLSVAVVVMVTKDGEVIVPVVVVVVVSDCEDDAPDVTVTRGRVVAVVE